MDDTTQEPAPVEPTNGAGVMPEDPAQDVEQTPTYEGDES